MEEPNLGNACPYCFATITLTEDRFKLWPLWEVCPNCGKKFARDRVGRTVKIEHLYLAIATILIVIGVFTYLMLR